MNWRKTLTIFSNQKIDEIMLLLEPVGGENKEIVYGWIKEIVEAESESDFYSSKFSVLSRIEAVINGAKQMREISVYNLAFKLFDAVSRLDYEDVEWS